MSFQHSCLSVFFTACCILTNTRTTFPPISRFVIFSVFDSVDSSSSSFAPSRNISHGGNTTKPTKQQQQQQQRNSRGMLPSVFDSVNSLGRLENHSQDEDNNDEGVDDARDYDAPEEEEEEEGDEEGVGVVPMSPIRIEIRRPARARANNDIDHEGNPLTASSPAATVTRESVSEDGTKHIDNSPFIVPAPFYYPPPT